MPEPTPKFAPGQRLKFDPERALWREVGDELVIFEVPTTTYLTLQQFSPHPVEAPRGWRQSGRAHG